MNNSPLITMKRPLIAGLSNVNAVKLTMMMMMMMMMNALIQYRANKYFLTSETVCTDRWVRIKCGREFYRPWGQRLRKLDGRKC